MPPCCGSGAKRRGGSHFRVFGVFGWLATKLRLEVAPFIIGFILGPSAEIYFVKSLESFGDLTICVTKSWIAVIMWVLIIGSLALSIAMARANKRSEASAP